MALTDFLNLDQPVHRIAFLTRRFIIEVFVPNKSASFPQCQMDVNPTCGSEVARVVVSKGSGR